MEVETVGRYKKTYYGMYSKDGFGVYSCKNRMDDAASYTTPIETGEFQSEDEAVWFVQDGKKYYYMFPSYDLVKDIDVFKLENRPIESLENYLLK